MARRPPSERAGARREPVGYGHPPREHRIREEEVRNPWGRKGKPKKPVDFLDQPVTLQVQGEPCTMRRAEALDHFLFVQAAKGNVRAIQLLELRAQARRQSAAVPEGAELTPEEWAAFDRFVERRAVERKREGKP